MVFLYMPTMKVSLNNAHNKEVVEISQKLNDANLSMESLKSENDSLNDQVNKLNEVNNTSTENMNYKLLQYVYLVGVVKEYNAKNYTKAAEIFSSIDTNQLTDVDNGPGISITGIFGEIAPKMRADGQALAYKASGDVETANNLFTEIITAAPEDKFAKEAQRERGY